MRTIAIPALTLLLAGLLASGAAAQLVNEGFDTAFPNPTGWTVGPNTTATVSFSASGGMPTGSPFYLVINSSGVAGSTPHSNEGGAGTDAQNTATVSQSFTVPGPNTTLLQWDCQLMSTDAVNPDFLEVSVSDGTTTYNVLHLDTGDVVGGFSPLTLGSADLGALFPSAQVSTVFTLTLHVGNAVNGNTPSIGHFDEFRFSAGSPFEQDEVNFVDQGAFQLIDIHTVQSGRRVYHLLSANTSGPVGGGTLVGLYLDPLIFSILEQPLGTPGFHVLTDGNGDYFTTVPTFAVPTGATFDYLIAVLDPPTSEVQNITAPKRYVWP